MRILKLKKEMLHPDPCQRMQISKFSDTYFDEINNLDFEIDKNMFNSEGRSTMANASFYLNYGHQKTLPSEKIGHGEIGDSELWAQFSAITCFMREIESFIKLETDQTLCLNFHQILDTLLFCLSPRINKGLLLRISISDLFNYPSNSLYLYLFSDTH